MAKKKKSDVTGIYANRLTKPTNTTNRTNQTQAPNPALAQSIVNTVTAQSMNSENPNLALIRGRTLQTVNSQGNTSRTPGINITSGAASSPLAQQKRQEAQSKKTTGASWETNRKAQNKEIRQAAIETLKTSDIGTTATKLLHNPVMWASDTFGSAVDSSASGLASAAATLTDFGAQVNERTNTGDPKWQREQAAKLRNIANANAESAAKWQQDAVTTLGGTKSGELVTKFGVTAAQQYIDALTGSALGKGVNLIRGSAATSGATTLENTLGYSVGKASGKGTLPMLVRSFGYGAQEAADAGFGEQGQVLNGLVIAGDEYLSEMLFGGNPVYDEDVGLVNQLLGKVLSENSPVIKALASEPADIVYEGLEEVVSDMLDPLIHQGALWATKDERIEVDWPKAEELLEDFAMGSALSATTKLMSGNRETRELRQELISLDDGVDASIDRLVQITGDNSETLRGIVKSTWQDEQRLMNNLAAYFASEPDVTAEDAASAAQTAADLFYRGLAAAQQTQTQNAPVQQTAQEAAQQATQPTEAGIAPQAENAASGAFNTAETAQEAAPTQTVADIYANRGTRQPDGAIQVGRATTIKKPYTGTVPVQTQYAETVVPISDDSLATAQSRIAEAKADASKKTFKSALSSIYKKVFQPMKNVPVDSMTYDGQPYAVDVNKGVYRKVISDGTVSAEKLVVLDSLPDVIQNAQYVGSGEYGKAGKGHNDNIVRYDYFETVVTINGKNYIVSFDVAVFDDVNNYRTHKISEIEMTPATGNQLLLTGPTSAVSIEDTHVSNDTIAQEAEPVKADGLDMGEGSVSPEDSTGAAPAGFDRVSQWQMEADEYHPVNEEAAQTTLENRGRVPMDIPTTDRNGRQVSKLVSTLVNANITTNEAAAAIAEDARNGVFSALAYTDEAAAQKANDHIEKVGWDVAFGEFQNDVMNGRVSKDINMLGIALYNNAVNAGALADAMDVVALLTHGSARNAAQALQVLNMINKASPESQLYLAMRGLGALVEDAQKRYGKRAENLTIDDALLQQYKDAMMSGDEKAAEAAWNQIVRDVAQQIPASFAEKLNNWRYLAMLGNPRTHVRNIAGNLGFAPVRVVSNMISTGIQSVVLDKANRRRAYMNFAKGENRDRFTAAWKYYGKAMDSTQDGGKYSDAINEVDKARTIFQFKPLEALRKGSSKALDIEDQWFSQPAFAYALSSYMAAHNIAAEELNAPTMSDEMAKGIAYAADQAKKATYRDSNAFSDWVTKTGESNKVTRGIKGAVLPFKRTPANILVRGVEYSPVGLVKGLTYDLVQVKKGNMEAAQAIDNISSGLTGTGLVALGIYLASQGLITASGDPEDEDQNWFNDLMGYQNYALNVGDKSVTIDWIAPGVMPLFVGVELQKAFADKKMTLSESLSALGNLTNPMVETSMLSSIDDLLETIQNSDSPLPAIESVAASYLSQYIPTLTGQLERTIEKQRYETYRYSDTGALGLSPTAQSQLGKLLNKIPGVEFSQIPYIDAWGREEESGSIGTRIFNNFLNPAYVNDIQRGEVEEELQRLHDENYSGVLPDRPSQSTKIQQLGGEYMTKDEYVQYARTSGSESLKMISELIHSDYYDKLDDDEKAKLVSELYSLATDKAKRQIVTGRGIDYSSDYDKYQSIEDPVLYLAMKEAMKDLRESGGADNEAFNAVYNQWKGLSQNEKKLYTDGIDGEFSGIDTLKKLNTCLQSGMSTEQFYKAKNAHDDIGESEVLNASEKRAKFANWLDTKSGLTTAQKRTALSTFPYTTTLIADEGNYEKLTSVGVSKDGGMRLFNAMQALEPAEGYTEVANWQKCETVTSSSLSDEEQLAALSVYATDSAYDYYQTAYDNGITPSKWSEVLANMRGYAGTLKSDGKTENTGSLSQENLLRAMQDAGLSAKKQRAMYAAYAAKKNWASTYDKARNNIDWRYYGY